MNPFAPCAALMNSVVTPAGTVAGRGTVVQRKDPTVADPSGFDNVSGDQTITMASNFTVGNSVIVPLSHYQSGSLDIASVTIAGTAATRKATETVGAARLQDWFLDAVVNAGRNDVVIHFASGSGHYLDIGPIETTPCSWGATVRNAATSTSPTATSGTPSQCEVFYTATWRDGTGVNNTAVTPIPSGWTRDFFVPDGFNNLGGAGADKQGTQKGTAQTVTFACSGSTTYACDITTWNWALPVALAGVSVQLWAGSDAWNPTTQSVVVSSTAELLVTFGAWWDGNGLPSALPTDNQAGTMVAAFNPSSFTGNVSYPITIQVAYKLAPSVATHVMTPPAVQSGGDGYFGAFTMDGIDATTPIRDSGSVCFFHTPVTPPDSNTIQSGSVSTLGSLAQVGDKALLIVVMDPNSASNADCAWVPPADWLVLANKFDVRDCVGMLACVGTVKDPGKISALASLTDPNNFVLGFSLTVFKKA